MQAFRSAIESPTLRSIWAVVYGDFFGSDLEPPWTLSTIDDLRFRTDTLQLAPEKDEDARRNLARPEIGVALYPARSDISRSR